MAIGKRSFFEKLTGSVNLDSEMEDVSAGQSSSPWQEESPEGELAVDIYQNSAEVVIQTMVAGVKPEDLNVSITREMVTIQGKRDRPSGLQDEDYFQQELYWGSFSRSIVLPSEVDVEESEAIARHGLLTLRLPKIDKQKSSKLKIKSA